MRGHSSFLRVCGHGVVRFVRSRGSGSRSMAGRCAAGSREGPPIDAGPQLCGSGEGHRRGGGGQCGPRRLPGVSQGPRTALPANTDQAAAVFDAMQKDFPKSDWLRRARLAKAVTLARKGDFRAAELIVRAEAEYLLSADRKQQIADIYLEFADRFFKPPKDTEKPDYARALEFYRKALEVGPKPAKRIEVEMSAAQCVSSVCRNWPAAAALYEKFIQDHPRHALAVEARFHLGECRLAEGDRKQARRVWQDLIAGQAANASEKRGGAASPWIADAQFQLARTWNIPKPENDEELNLGVAALRAFVERFPAHKLAGQRHLEIAESFVARGRHEDAVAAIGQFLADPHYRDREEIPVARELLGRCYRLQKKYPEAIRVWREYLVKHPGPQTMERGAARDHRRRVSDGRGQIGGQAIRRGQPSVRGVHGEVSAGRAAARHSVVDEREALRGGEMGRSDRQLAAVGVEVSRQPRGLAGPVLHRRHVGVEARQAGGGPGGVSQSGRGPGGRRGPAGHRPIDGHEHDGGHGARLPQRRNAAAETDHAERRVGDGPRATTSIWRRISARCTWPGASRGSTSR